MDRNTKGIIGWSALTIALTIALSFVWQGVQAVLIPFFVNTALMAGREVWQYKTGRAIEFEWDDIHRYLLTILATTVLTGFLLIAFGVIE